MLLPLLVSWHLWSNISQRYWQLYNQSELPFRSCLALNRFAPQRFLVASAMFDTHWPEVTGAKQELGLVQPWLCSTEAFWIELLPQWLLRGHRAFIRWMGICIYASSPLSPWDKAQPCCPGTQQDRPRASRLACCAESAQREQRAKKCSERPVLGGAFNENMNGLRKFSPGCFLFCPHKRLSPMHSGRPVLHSLRGAACTWMTPGKGRKCNIRLGQTHGKPKKKGNDE